MSLYPNAVYRPVSNHSGTRTAKLGFCVHEQEGNGSCYGEFNNQASQASSTFWISKTGHVEQYMDTDVVSWAQMAGNELYISCEFEGFQTEPMTEAQLVSGGLLIAWCAEKDGFPLVAVDHGGHGVTTHCHYPSGAPDPAYGDHPCPGPIRILQVPELIARAAGTWAAAQPPTAPTYPGGIMAPTEYAGMARTPTGKGYWLAKSDGSIITEGDASYHGGANVDSTGKPAVLNAPIVGIAAHPTQPGYWLVGADGGVFAYGACGFHGSAGALTLAAPIKGIEATPTGNGYWLDAGDGGIFAYGDADFEGSGAGA